MRRSLKSRSRGYVMAIFILMSVSIQLWAKEADNPNIIVILVDDLGYGDLSINGGKDIYTPHIDELCEQGM